MMRHLQKWALVTCLAALAPLTAQDSLTLKQAVGIALDSSPVIEAARAGEQQAEAGIGIVKADRLPNVALRESFTRSNNPVFVFGSLLNQRQFGPENFAIESLNHPDPLNLFQSVVRIEQVLFDAHHTKNAIQAARHRRELSAEDRRAGEAAAILAVVSTYFGVVLADESVHLTEQTRKSVEADLRRAQAMLEAGMATRADALSMKVQLAAIDEEHIQARSRAQVTRAALNDALGLDLNQPHTLATPLQAIPAADSEDIYERMALEQHPDLRRAALGVELSAAEVRTAKSALWPRVTAQGILEADRGAFAARAGGNWLAGVSLDWQVWNGNGNRARIAAAQHAEGQAAALRRRAESAVRLRVRQAHSEWQAAGERIAVGDAAVQEAEESHRILQDRYENGLVTASELIRGQTALMAARFRRLAALYDLRVARAALDEAAGVLTADSEALQ